MMTKNNIEETDYYLDERVKISCDLIIKYSYLFKELPKLKIVDLGCGDGRAAQKMIERLAKDNVIIEKLFAIDINPTLKSSDKIQVIKSDFNQAVLPLEDNSVHIIYCLETIEHLTNPIAFVKEANRILVENGIFVITTPNIMAWYNRILFPLGSLPIHYEVTEAKNYGRLIAGDSTTVGHIRVFSPRAAKQLLSDHGFNVLKNKGLKFIFNKESINHRKFSLIDSFFAHFPSFSSMFSVIAVKDTSK